MRGSRPAPSPVHPWPRDGALCSCGACHRSLFRYPKNRKGPGARVDKASADGPEYVSHTDAVFGMRKMYGGRLKIGRQDQRSSAISTANEQTILVRGRDLARELIGTIGFTDHIWLLITGALPTPAQRRVLDATLVAIAEHGLVPSVQAGRMTLAAAPEALQGAGAAGILGCGSVVLGSSEAAGQFLAEIAALAAAGGGIEHS